MPLVNAEFVGESSVGPIDVMVSFLEWCLRKGQKRVNVWVLVIALLTRLEQQRFTISEVAADWHELMIP